MQNILPAFYAMKDIERKLKAPGKEKMTKAKVEKPLKEYLEKVRSIADCKETLVKCPWDGDIDLSSLDKWERLEKLVFPANSIMLQIRKKRFDASESLFHLIGMEVSNETKYTIKLEDESEEEWKSDEAGSLSESDLEYWTDDDKEEEEDEQSESLSV